MSKEKAFDDWTVQYKEAAKLGTELCWPSETLIRLFKGNYIPNLDKDFAGKRILDVSFGNGNNMPLYVSLGLDIYGTEVSGEICEQLQQKLENANIKTTLKAGVNQNLPFEDDFFDYLVSWNVIHYEPTEKDMVAAIQEYSRVLKPGGRLFLSTTGPEHLILEGAENIGKHQYQIGREDDFRKGQVYFYFDEPKYIHHYFKKDFKDIQVGRTHDMLMTDTLDWWIATGVKP